MIDARGRKNLAGVHPRMVQFTIRVSDICPINFTIVDGGGLRSPAQARQNAAAGTGVVNSAHLPQRDGYSHAVDLVPVKGLAPSWDQPLCAAMRPYCLRAADELQIDIQHGADWDIDGTPAEPGEYDWPHWQFANPLLPGRVAAARLARAHRVNARARQIYPCARGAINSADVVTAVQRLLGVAPDGQFGPGTERAVRDFQIRRADLVASGAVDAYTAAALQKFELQPVV